MPEPSDPDPLPRYLSHSPAENRRWVERDLDAGITRYRILEDSGLTEHPGNGLATRSIREETWAITAGDPLSMTGASQWTWIARREGWSVRTIAASKIGCTDKHWITASSVTAFEDGTEVRRRTSERRIPRDFM